MTYSFFSEVHFFIPDLICIYKESVPAWDLNDIINNYMCYVSSCKGYNKYAKKFDDVHVCMCVCALFSTWCNLYVSKLTVCRFGIGINYYISSATTAIIKLPAISYYSATSTYY